MTFPSGTISADDIRYQLAYNNTAGAQTPVTLNDLPVRQAADKLTGTVSYNDLLGKNVFFSGTITWGYTPIGLNELWGYNNYGSGGPYYGYNIGSVGTTSYYRLVSVNSSSTPSYQYISISAYYNDNIGSTQTNIIIGDYPTTSIYPVPTSGYVNIYIDGTKYTLYSSNYGFYGWSNISGDPLSLEYKNGQTNQVVITY
jgi:hypothetical protein